MKVLDYLKQLPMGEPVNKRVLAILKRKGLIYDYSQWGYLESVRITWQDKGMDISFDHRELFPNANAPKVTLRNEHDFYGSTDEMYEFYGHPWSEIEYKGFKFQTKYFSGCFYPYLVKCA